MKSNPGTSGEQFKTASIVYDKASIDVVHLPLRAPGPFGADAETVQVRNLPNHILVQVERSLDREKNGFFRYDKSPGMPDDAADVFGWLVGGLQGTESIDKTTSKQLDRLVSEFSRAPKKDRAAFFKDRIRPFFSGLRTASR